MMVSRIHLINVFVTTLFVLHLSSSSPIEKDSDEWLLLIARVDGLQAKIDQLLIRLDDEQVQRTNLQTLNEKMEAKIDILEVQNTQQEEEIRLLKNRNVADDKTIEPYNKSIKKELKNDDSSFSPRLPPSSCRQLSTIGHFLDGIYLVANPDTRKIETVYCDFGSSTLSETLFGSVDVKSKSVHFTVQRTASDFSLANAVVPFDIERLNVGGAMNLAAGVFTVPVDGIYHFEFSGMKSGYDSENLFIHLQVNGEFTVTSCATDIYAFLSVTGIGASLRLKVGDQVSLFKTTGTLHDTSYHYSYFSGWLVEEDLMLVQ